MNQSKIHSVGMYRSVEIEKAVQNLHLVEMQPKNEKENTGCIPQECLKTRRIIFYQAIIPNGIYYKYV
jgi:hypothetical protein